MCLIKLNRSRLKQQSLTNQRVQTLPLNESHPQTDSVSRGFSRTAELANDIHCDLLQWLSPYDHRYRHSVIVRDRVEGTGRWILSTAAYSNWKTGRERTVLHFVGAPGVGKTVIAYALPLRTIIRFRAEGMIDQ